MTEETSIAQSPATLTGVAMISAYVDDFEAGYRFYRDILGLEKQHDMGDNACYFRLGEDSGLYLQGGNKPAPVHPESIRTSFTVRVGSASALHERLVAAGVRTVHPAPMHMGGEYYWFQFYDPAGNILEALGGK